MLVENVLRRCKMKTYLMIVGMLCVLLVASDGSAFITGVTIEDFFDEWAGVAIADNIINGSGLDINGPDTHSDVNNTMWQSDSGPPSAQWLVVDLGASYDLASMKVWNFNEQGQAAAGFNFQHYTQGSGTKDILLRGSDTIPAGNDWTLMTNLGTIQVPMAHGGANGNDTTPFGTTIPLSASSIRYLMLDIQSSWDDGSGYPWVGLSEVRFTEVPEPATLALLGLGLPWLRKKRRKLA
jgi:hypothetical protein